MKCDGQISVKLDKPKSDGKGGWIYSIPLNCGKCLNCKKNRVSQWSFRLMMENKVSTSANFITLTYDTIHVPITSNGFMTLRKEDLQSFFKRLRYYEDNLKKISKQEYEIVKRGGNIQKQKKLKYYAVGEYGTRRKRPHYHIILFNLKDEQSVWKAWTSGNVHIDEVNNNTIDYTLKYIQKESNRHKFRAFDGIMEFSIMSKGIGDNFRSPGVDRFYQKNLDVNYVVAEKGYKVPMPKYYRDKIFECLSPVELNEEGKYRACGRCKNCKGKDSQISIIKEEVEREMAKVSEKSRILSAQARSIILKRGQNRQID